MIRIYTIKDFNGDIAVTQVHISNQQLDSFKLLVRRALNVWPDAPAELKEFGDMLEYGRLLQDYKAQNQPMKKFHEKLPPLLTDEMMYTCDKCNGIGYHHMFNCPVLRKDNTIESDSPKP